MAKVWNSEILKIAKVYWLASIALLVYTAVALWNTPSNPFSLLALIAAIIAVILCSLGLDLIYKAEDSVNHLLLSFDHCIEEPVVNYQVVDDVLVFVKTTEVELKSLQHVSVHPGVHVYHFYDTYVVHEVSDIPGGKSTVRAYHCHNNT
jgi:hypothetical protein